jgi:hypothetical protein
MTFTASGFFYLTWRDILMNDTAVDQAADSIKVALFTNSITTPNYDTNTAYAAAPFNANEVGTPSGGIALGSPAFSVTTGTLKYDATDTAWGSQTITNARGCLIYDDTIATPVSKPAILGVTFGADFSVTSGVLTIVWDAAGIYTATPF